jgi:SWIM zinc finger
VAAFSTEQVLAMAPDVASARAGRGQAVKSAWNGLGHDVTAVWGECQGSGRSAYRTQASLADGATRCTCPSRKFPCKHALGLLLLLADAAVPSGAPPDWVTEWPTARAARQSGPARRAPAAEPADPQASQRRAASRESKVDAGVLELSRWLFDLASGGLAAAQAQPWQWWDQLARRMIDAQARGLASHVRRMASIAATGAQRSDWPDRMVDQLGSAHLLCEAWTRRDELPGPTAQALRVRVGYSTSAEEVVQAGERLTDTWAVLGQRTADDGNLRSLQQWLYGEGTGAIVTFLAFAAGGQPVDPGLPPGRQTEATVAVYPGTMPRRILITERRAASLPLGPLPGDTDWDSALVRVAEMLSVDPWADVAPIAVRGVTVLPGRDGRGPWLLRDKAGRALPIAADADTYWRLLAISTGRPLDVAGEWDGFAFRAQAAAPAGEHGRLIA